MSLDNSLWRAPRKAAGQSRECCPVESRHRRATRQDPCRYIDAARGLLTRCPAISRGVLVSPQARDMPNHISATPGWCKPMVSALVQRTMKYEANWQFFRTSE